jgi:hypothetical protein
MVTVPIAVAGLEAAHATANALFGAPAGDGEVFASSASRAAWLPLLLALTGALVLAGVVARALEASAPARRAAPVFAAVPPVGFVLLELVEGLLHSGVVPFGSLAEPTFLAGLALQLPFALAGYLAVRALLRSGESVSGFLGRLRPLWAAFSSRIDPPAAGDGWARPRPRSWACSGRAPPLA